MITPVYTKGDWDVVRDVSKNDYSGFAIGYNGNDSFYNVVTIRTTTRESAIVICDCLAKNAC